MAAGRFGQTSQSNDGVQFLCAKYSTLVTRLKEELLARQRAEADVKRLEQRLKEESLTCEKERAVREVERRTLHDEILGLQHDVAALQLTESTELHRTTATSEQLSARCEHLHQACTEQSHRALQLWGRANEGSCIQLRQGEELTRLRREHSDLLAEHQEANRELLVSRDHVARWRRTATELEGRVEALSCGRDDAEGRIRGLQGELRKALRAASAARHQEATTANCAGRGARALRSRDARLAAVRLEGQRHARRATSAERRLVFVENCEVANEKAAFENKELYRRLETEARSCEAARLQAVRAEAAEVRAAAAAGEARSAARATEAIYAASHQRTLELQGELVGSRARLDQLDGERRDHSLAIEELRQELHGVHSESEATRRSRDKLFQELTEARRRIDRGVPQVADYRRRLSSTEDALVRAQAEVTEERRARERCHLEAVRTAEKLRMVRSQGDQLRQRIRSLEASELRYLSRYREGPVTSLAEPSWELSEPFKESRELPETTALDSRHCADELCLEDCGCVCANTEVEALRNFVALEDERLALLESGGDLVRASGDTPGATNRASQHVPEDIRAPIAAANTGTVRLSGEERPRPMVPLQAQLAAAGRDSGEALTVLLAAEPRTLRLPDPPR